MNGRLRRSALLGILLMAPAFAQVDSTTESLDQQMPMPMPQQKAGGQQPPSAQMSGHQRQGMPGMSNGMQMNEAGMYLMSMASGTSMNPLSWPMPMLMRRSGSWNLMLMGQAFIVDTQQSGPRGGDKLYSPNAFMFSAEHSIGNGSLMLQSMLSLEPATITNRSYPLLFQTGETAYGRPLVDAQHPHNLFMALGVQYAHPLGDDTILQLYYAPVVGFPGWSLSGCGGKIGIRSQQRNQPRSFQHGTTIDLHSSTSRTKGLAPDTLIAIIGFFFRCGP